MPDSDEQQPTGDEPEQASDESPAIPPPRSRVVAWLAAPSWAGIGGIVSVLALIITVAVVFIPSTGSGPSDGSSGSAPAASPSSLASGTPPFTTTVAVNKATCDGATGYHVVPPELVASVLPYSNVRNDPAFRNAPDAIYTDVVVTLQGKTGVATILQGITVHVTSRAKPAGAAFRDGELECGSISPAFFGINLDRDAPRAASLPGRHGDPARPFPFTISDSDPEVFHIYGVTRTCDCRWYVELEWSSAGTTGTMTVDDHGQPFRTVGTDGIRVTSVTEDRRSWTPATHPPYSPMD